MIRPLIAAAALIAAASSAMGGIEITNNVPLAFGSLVAAAASGTVTIAPDGTRSSSVVTPVGASGFSAASFTVTRSGGNPHFQIVLPSAITLTGPGTTMTIDALVSNPSGTGMVPPPAGTKTLTVGGTLHVAASQAPGTYSGTFLVIVTQQ